MDPGTWKWRVRAAASLLVVLSLGLLVGSALAGPAAAPTVETDASPALSPSAGEQTTTTAGQRTLTVVTTQGFYTGIRPGDRDVADLLAVDAEGTVVYHNSTYDVYFDVDPVPGTQATVEYVAARRLGGPDCEVDPCSLNLVERVNLTTGETTRVYDAVTPQYDTGRWHDVDRLNQTHLVVADIVHDRVYVVDVRTDEITWEWNANERYPPTAGGGSGDWTHLNDVEILDSGWVMASLRNMDSVVFIDPTEGLVEEWTLGTDDARDILNEQHNPDYFPVERGGPAVLVSDSENNRVIEYRRAEGQWLASWSWRDGTLQWPRDADRLPNGHTLIADAHGDRIIEVDTDGSIVWQIEVGRPYDVERLGTGDESSGGHAAGSIPTGQAAGGAGIHAPPATSQGPAGHGSPLIALKDALPGRAVNGLLFLAPRWAGFTDLVVAWVLLVTLLLWFGLEWHWSTWSIRGEVRRLRARI